MKIKFLALVATALFFAACEKNEDNDPKEDKQAPAITVLAPDTTAYMSGDTMPLKADITDNDELHEIHLTVTNLTDSTELFHLHQHQHGQHATIDTAMVIPSGPMHREFEIKFEASDHNGNFSEEIVLKHIHM